MPARSARATHGRAVFQNNALKPATALSPQCGRPELRPSSAVRPLLDKRDSDGQNAASVGCP